MKALSVLCPLFAVSLLLVSCSGQPASDPQDDANEVLSGSVLKADEPTQAGGDCEAACANYVNKCLTLVPGADESLFQQGLVSCMEECAQWGSEKAGCILAASDCPSMTDACGL